MGQGVSPADVQVAAARHSFEDETMRTGDTVSWAPRLGAGSLVRDQLLSFRSYAARKLSPRCEASRTRAEFAMRKRDANEE